MRTDFSETLPHPRITRLVLSLWGAIGIFCLPHNMAFGNPPNEKLPEIRIAGSDSTYRCHWELLDAFQNISPCSARYLGGGSEKGLALFCEGKAELVFWAVPWEKRHQKQLEKHFANSICPPEKQVFSQTALVYIVHPQNPVSHITLSQLKDIWGGEIQNWKEINGQDAEIHLYGTSRSRNSTVLLKQQVLQTRRWQAKNVMFCQTAEGVVKKIAGDRDGIGYCLAFTKEESKSVRLLGVAKSSRDKPVLPTPAAIYRKEYPLTSCVYLLIHPMASSLACRYAEYICGGNAANIVQRWGFFPAAERKQILSSWNRKQMRAGVGEPLTIAGQKDYRQIAKTLATAYGEEQKPIQFHYSIRRTPQPSQGNHSENPVKPSSVYLSSIPFGKENKKSSSSMHLLEKHIPAARGIAVIVHTTNPITSLSVSDLTDMLMGKIRIWSEIQGGNPLGKIAIYSQNPTSSLSLRDFHRNILRAWKRTNVRYRATGMAVFGAVANDKKAIGLVDLTQLSQKIDNLPKEIKVIAIGEKNKAFWPTCKNLLDSRYPLGRPLEIHIDPNAGDCVKGFVQFLGTFSARDALLAEGFLNRRMLLHLSKLNSSSASTSHKSTSANKIPKTQPSSKEIYGW